MKAYRRKLIPMTAFGILFAIGYVITHSHQAAAQNSNPGSTFVSATSMVASCVNPPGPCGALVSLPINLKADSLLTITFSARGTVFQPTTAIVETAINCNLDGTPCEPNTNSVEFLYPPFCCDTRSFTWVQEASEGLHTVTISWTTLNTGTSFVSNRTLVVQAAAKL